MSSQYLKATHGRWKALLYVLEFFRTAKADLGYTTFSFRQRLSLGFEGSFWSSVFLLNCHRDNPRSLRSHLRFDGGFVAANASCNMTSRCVSIATFCPWVLLRKFTIKPTKRNQTKVYHWRICRKLNLSIELDSHVRKAIPEFNALCADGGSLPRSLCT